MSKEPTKIVEAKNTSPICQGNYRYPTAKKLIWGALIGLLVGILITILILVLYPQYYYIPIILDAGILIFLFVVSMEEKCHTEK